ncbi:MAG TPA: alpha/beta hydrolase [Acidimicrobiales bacterium]|nr:alpha/beta hydrolase [Acidimicrobiales bacterium]
MPAARRRTGPVAALAAAATVVAACSASPGGGAGRDGASASARTSSTVSAAVTLPHRSTTTEPPTTTTLSVDDPPVTPVQWSSCGDLQCGSVTVPLDYADPARGTIQIAVARHPATDPAQRIGSIVINPGGPGGSGIDDLPDELDVLTPELLARFDIVSFDPRGVGRSDPVECAKGASATTPSTPGPLPDPVPTTAAAQQALLANDKAFGAACEAVSGSILPYVGTVDTARDLERIRMALGDPGLTYIGHSYGTLLGATYAQLFPTHVRAMVLDGAIDPALSAEQIVMEQADGFEHVLESFFTWCGSGCAWQEGSDPTATLLALINRSRAARLPAGGGRSAGPGEIYNAVLDSMYSTASWPRLASALAQAEGGDGAAVLALSDSYLTFNGPNAADAEQAIDCLDHPVTTSLSGFPGLALEAATTAPVFGPVLTWGLAGCAQWPVPATRTPAPTTAVGSPPIIVTGATGDPATPYAWAQSLASELQHGVLVTWVGEDHVAYYYSACVRAVDQAYLVNGTVPAPGTVCRD